MGWFEKVREAGGWRLVCKDLGRTEVPTPRLVRAESRLGMWGHLCRWHR